MSIKKQFLKSKPVVKITFEIEPVAAGEANEAFVLCEASDWEKTPLKKLKTGAFRGSMELPTDRQDDFEFRYCLKMPSGEEVYDNDWRADAYRPTALGVDNSVVSVRA